jgi:F-type H+-transporting ATPase subunit gamma
LTSKKGRAFSKDLIFEPPPEDIIEDLLHKHFSVQVYRCMSESIAAEHAARMTAMENATNNARDMISSLTLTYNKLRQASITRELIEICSGAEALKE